MTTRCQTCGQPLPSALGITFDADSGIVSRGDLEARLTPRAAVVFGCLLERYPRVQSNLDIWDYVYDGGFAGDPELKIIDVWICKIRARIKPLEIGIETIWGQGYRLTSDMEKALPRQGVHLTAGQKDEIRRRWRRLETDEQISGAMGLTHSKVGYERKKMDLTRWPATTKALRKAAIQQRVA